MKIFLSYVNSIGSQFQAEVIAEALTKSGYTVFRKAAGITGGSNWEKQTRETMTQSDWVVVLVTPQYVSTADAEELRIALELQKPILYLKTQPLPDAPNFEMNPLLDLSSESSSNWGESIINYLQDTQRSNRTKLDKRIHQTSDDILDILKSPEEQLRKERVFIAYSRKQRQVAENLADLFAKHGIAFFWDAKIHAGATWRQTIQKALDDCTHLIVIWTQDAAGSDEVEREVSYALAEGKIIIPILSKDIPKLPYHLHGFHYVVLEDDRNLIEGDIIKAIESYSDEDIWQ